MSPISIALTGKFVYVVADTHADGIAMGKIYRAAAIIHDDEGLSSTMDKSALQVSLS
jgi:hypothetical protein